MAMPDSQRYPWNHYLINNNVEDNLLLLWFKHCLIMIITVYFLIVKMAEKPQLKIISFQEEGHLKIGLQPIYFYFNGFWATRFLIESWRKLRVKSKQSSIYSSLLNHYQQLTRHFIHNTHSYLSIWNIYTDISNYLSKKCA